MRKVSILAIILMLVAFCSCKKSNKKLSEEVSSFTNLAEKARTSEVVIETGEAQNALKQLHLQGRLPGDSQNEHEQLTCDLPKLIVSNQVVKMTYPASRTFHLVHVGKTITNNYTLIKRSGNSEWKLQRAWQTDSNGQVVQRWPIQ